MAFEDRQNRGSVQWAPQVVFDIPFGKKVLSGVIILRGPVVVSGGTTSGTLKGEGGPVGLIKHIRVTANAASGSRYPNGDLVDNSPQDLLRIAIAQRGGKFMSELSGNVLSNGDAAANNIYLAIPIYWADSTAKNEVQTALNMDLADSQGNPIYAKVQVRIDMATDLTGCFSGNDRLLNMSGVMVDWWDDRLGLSFDTTPVVYEGHDLIIPAAQPRLLDQAMPNDGAFTHLLMLAQQNNAQTLSDAILNKWKIRGSNLDFEENALDTRQQMYSDNLYDLSQSGIGQYLVDFTHGLLQNSNAAGALAFEFDVNNPSGSQLDKLRVITRRFFPLAA